MLGPALVAAVVLLMGLRTWLRTPSWRSSATVFQVMLDRHPESGRSQWVLGNLFYVQGRVPEALHAYASAIGTLDSHHQIMTDIGKRLIGAKRYRAADFILLQAWQQEPFWGVAPAFLAMSRLQQGDWANAERYARASLAVAPNQGVTADVLASALAAQGRFADAIPWRRTAIEHGQGDKWEQWMTLARLEMTVGDRAAAQMARDSAIARAKTPDQRALVGTTLEPLEAPPADR
jgi:Tfp pilus assembly protein PilF